MLTCLRIAAVAIAILALPAAARAQTDFQVLHSFTPSEGIPVSPLVQGRDGNLYGMTSTGGTFGNGTVFKMTPDGALTVLHSFEGSSSFSERVTRPFILARDGSFYGGRNRAIFRMTPDGTVTFMATLPDPPYRGGPDTLVETADGTLYGTAFPTFGSYGQYVARIFRVTPDGALTTLYTLPGNSESSEHPYDITQVVDGSFWISSGYTGSNDRGVLSHMSADGSSITRKFLPDGFPTAITQGPDGLYVTASGDRYPDGKGRIFTTTDGTSFTLLHHFSTGLDNPSTNPNKLLLANDGNFYGTTRTYFGAFPATDPGLIYRMTPDGQVTILVELATPIIYPLIQAFGGTFYTNTYYGGAFGNGMVLRVRFGAPCEYGLSPATTSFPSGGGSSTASVVATSGCGWMATTDATWISLDAASGSGDGTIAYTVMPNPAHVARTATIAVGASTITIIQDPAPCQYVVSPLNPSFGSGGGSGSLSVTSECGWTASTGASWISLGTADGNGNGTIPYSVAPNPTPIPRTGTITAAFATVTVSQDRAPCEYAVSSLSPAFGAAGGSGSASVTTTDGCSWTASTGASWISFGTAGAASGIGSGTLTFSVDVNPTYRSRMASITVGGQMFDVTQRPHGGAGDFDGDSASDLTVFRPSTGGWDVLKSSANYGVSQSFSWGLSTDVPVPGDYDGDGRSDPAVFRPSTGVWHILKSSTNYTTSQSVSWGMSTDVPAPGDYDGDGRFDPAIYRPSTGLWAVLKSSTSYGSAISVSWGMSTDAPMPGDYDGDGKTDPAVYRPSTGGWHILKSIANYTASQSASWGLSTDVPVPGDYDGDARTDPAVFRPSTGGWHFLQSTTGYATSAGVSWGLSTDTPVPGDYDGDGQIDPAVFRSSTARWLILLSNAHYSSYTNTAWGLGSDTPINKRP